MRFAKTFCTFVRDFSPLGLHEGRAKEEIGAQAILTRPNTDCLLWRAKTVSARRSMLCGLKAARRRRGRGHFSPCQWMSTSWLVPGIWVLMGVNACYRMSPWM